MEKPLAFTVCKLGAKCSLKYYNDWQRRLGLHGPEGQGTGDLCKDLEEIGAAMGLRVEATASPCLELCPLPWEKSMLIGPDGQGHEVYFEDLRRLLEQWC